MSETTARGATSDKPTASTGNERERPAQDAASVPVSPTRANDDAGATQDDARVQGPAPVASSPVPETVQEEPMELALLDDHEDDREGDVDAYLGKMDAVHDEYFMETVLQHEPFEKDERERAMTWEAIAEALIAGGEVDMVNRVDVTKRVGILTTALLERPQLLTPALRAMVLEFNEFNCKAGYATLLGDAFLAVLRKHAFLEQVTSISNIGDAAPSAKGDVFRKKAVEDEILMQLVMKHRPFEIASSQGKKPVWTKIVSEYNAAADSRVVCGVFKTEKSARSRVRAAVDAMLDHKKLYYAHLTPMIRAMIVELNLLTLGSNAGARIGSQSKPYSPRKAVSVVCQDDTADELLMRLVISFGGRPSNWQQISKAFVAASGVSKSHRTLANRVGRLTKTMVEQPQKLSPRLRASILEYHVLRVQAGGRRKSSDTTVEMLRKNVLEMATDIGEPTRLLSEIVQTANRQASGTQDRQREPRTPDPTIETESIAHVPPQISGTPVEESPFTTVSRNEEANCVAEGNGRPTNGTDSMRAEVELSTENIDYNTTPANRNQGFIVSAAIGSQAQDGSSHIDEKLMELVLETRPHFLSKPRDVLWNAVASRLEHVTPVLPNGQAVQAPSVQARVEWLQSAFNDPDCEENEHLSPALRSMLLDYTTANDEKLQQLLESLSEPMPTEEGDHATIVHESLDDALLREVFGVRFKPGKTKVAWNGVAAKVNSRVGTTVFSKGKSCKRRIKALLCMYRNPVTAQTLSNSERDKLRQLEAALQSKHDVTPERSSSDVADLPLGAPSSVASEPVQEAEAEPVGDETEQGSPAQDEELPARPTDQCSSNDTTPPQRDQCMTDEISDNLASDSVGVVEICATRSKKTPASSEVKKVRMTTHAEAHVELERESEPESGSESAAESDTRDNPAMQFVFPSFDEQLMRLVLKVRPYSAPAGKKMAAWAKIARAWTKEAGADAPMRLRGGQHVMARVKNLNMVRGDPSHRDHSELTGRLKTMLRAYDKARTQHQAKLTKEKSPHDKQQKATLPARASNRVSKSSRAESPSATQRKTRKEAKLVRASPRTSKSTSEDPASRTQRNSEHVSMDASKQTPTSAPQGQPSRAPKRPRSTSPTRTGSNPTKKAPRHIASERDASIVRRYLDLRPFWAHTKRKEPMWGLIAASTNSSTIRTRAAAQDLVEWLMQVAEDASHCQHRDLGAILPGLLKECLVVSDEKMASAYRRARFLVTKEGKLSTTNMTMDDIVLHEARTLKPQWSETQWNGLVERLNSRFGVKMFSSGVACRDRVKALLKVYHSDHEDPFISLTKQQEKLLEQFDGKKGTLSVDERKRVAPPSTSTSGSTTTSEQTRSKRRRVAVPNVDNDEASDDDKDVDEVALQISLELLPFRADYSLRRDAWNAAAFEVNKRLDRRNAFQSGMKLQAYIKRIHERIEADPDALSARTRELAAQYNALLPSPRWTGSDNTTESTNVEPASSRHDTPLTLSPSEESAQEPTTVVPETDPAAPAHTVEIPPIPSVPTVEVHPAPAIPSSRPSDSAAEGLTTELAAARTQTAQLLQQFEQERHEYRAQHETLVDLLRSEREAMRNALDRERQDHREALDRERQDRRDEFVAMVNLLSRMIPSSQQVEEEEVETPQSA